MIQALIIGFGLFYLGIVGAVIYYVARDKLHQRRAISRRLAHSIQTNANAAAKPVANVRIISQRPFVLLRTP